MIRKFFRRLLCDHLYQNLFRTRTKQFDKPVHAEAFKCVKCGKIFVTLEEVN